MTTAIIISLIISLIALVVVGGLGVWVWQLQVLASALRRRSEWFETDLVAAKRQGSEDLRSLRSEINALAGTVAANADRCTRLEGEDAPRRPACPATYLAERYPKRADEI